MAKEAKTTSRPRPAAKIVKGLEEAAAMARIDALEAEKAELFKLMQEQQRQNGNLENQMRGAQADAGLLRSKLESFIREAAETAGELRGYKQRTREVDGIDRPKAQIVAELNEHGMLERLMQMPDEQFDLVSKPLLDRMMGRTSTPFE